MQIWVNERQHTLPPGATIEALRDDLYPNADILIVNGGIVDAQWPLSEGDRVVFIRRGAAPAEDEFLALLSARHTPGVHAIVKRACVGIAGVGGLGSVAAMALARIGVGRLILADFDVVEPSNLNRQNYFADQLGQSKVTALTDTLRRINPYINIEPHQVRIEPANAATIFAHVDVLIEAFDTAAAKAMLADAFQRARPETPLILASGVAGHGPGNDIRVRRAGPALWVVGDESTAAAPGMGLMAPRVGIAAHHQALAALRLLLGETPE